MKSVFFLFNFLFCAFCTFSQQTPFEKSNGKETTTYFQSIEFYKHLDKASSKIVIKEMGPTDAAHPLHLVMVSNDGKFDPDGWHHQNKVVILVINGIHPGEPDGIDASMMLVRDIVSNKIQLPPNVALAFIPVYNIGGSLNRNSYSRVNQNGPVEYGFRGNSQNLDLNRDFTKNDSKESRTFVQLFHYLQPDILIDNHVSDGADYQYTMTMLTTQYDKLGAGLGHWLKEKFEPGLYEGMAKKRWEMTPYVNFETSMPDSGILQFYDQPRYSSGYAALFQTIAFVPETHMLKAFSDRVRSTYAFMQTVIERSAIKSKELIAERKKAMKGIITQKSFPLSWRPDSSKFSMINFKGYQQAFKTSEATGLKRMYYDHSKPFAKQVKFFNVFDPKNFVTKPKAYIIPQGWWGVIERLALNKVKMYQLESDSTVEVQQYHIDDYKSLPGAYEKHHKNYDVKVSPSIQKIKFLKGDYIIPMNQTTDRYVIEMLEPTGDDSFFAWNFFDGILQQKEGYSDYRWEDIAAEVVKNNPDLKQKLDAKKVSDTKFSNDAAAQLNFIYKNSHYYEPVHLRYPVYRLVEN